MNSISGCFFLLPLALIICFSLHPPIAAAAAGPQSNGTDLIAKACNDSPRQSFCISVLNSNPNSKSADLKGLAFIALKAASKNATDISARIKTMLNDTEVDPAVDDGIASCDQVYGDVVDQIADSVNALVSGAYGDVKTWMSAAIADIDTCDGGIKGLSLSGPALELSRKNRVLRQLCNVALSVVHVLGRN